MVRGECTVCGIRFVDRGYRHAGGSTSWQREPETFFCEHWRDADVATFIAAGGAAGRGEFGAVRAERV